MHLKKKKKVNSICTGFVITSGRYLDTGPEV